MAEYKVSAILWEDHSHFHRQPMQRDIDSTINPTLSVGIIYKETGKTITLVSDIERYDDRDDASYLVILKNNIISTKVYGKIKLKKLRT